MLSKIIYSAKIINNIAFTYTPIVYDCAHEALCLAAAAALVAIEDALGLK